MEINAFNILCVILSIFTIIVGTLFSIVLFKMIKLLNEIDEMFQLYLQIKEIFFLYKQIPDFLINYIKSLVFWKKR